MDLLPPIQQEDREPAHNGVQITGRPRATFTTPIREHEDVIADDTAPTLTLGDCLDIYHRRSKAIWRTFAIVIALGACWLIFGSPQYATTTELLVSTQRNDATQSTSNLPVLSDLAGLTSGRNIDTQVQILQSPDLQLKAMERTKARVPDLVQQKTITADEAKDWLKRLNRSIDARTGHRKISRSPIKIDISSTKDTDIITITATARYALLASLVAKDIDAEYLDEDVTQSREAASKAASFIKSEILRVGDSLNKSRRTLAAYKRQQKIPADISDTLKDFESRYSTLKAAAVDANQAYHEADATVKSYNGILSKTQRSILANVTQSSNPLVATIDQDIESLEQKRSNAILLYQPTSPEIRLIDQQIAAAQQRRAHVQLLQLSSRTTTSNPVQQTVMGTYLQTLAQRDAMKTRVAVLQKEVDEYSRQMAQLPGAEVHFLKLSTDVKEYESVYDLLNTQYQNWLITKESTLSEARVVTEAIPNDFPSSPNIPLMAMLIIFVAVVASICVAASQETLDYRIHSEDMIGKISNRPILAYFPFDEESPRLIDHHDTHIAILENIRLLRSNLVFASLDSSMRTLLVTSPGAGEGKSSLACNLAIALAMDGKRVVVVDADLRRPSLHRYFNVPQENGLTNVATGTITLDKALQEVRDNLCVLVSGPLPPNPPEVLNAQSVRQTIAQLTSRFDYVIIDSPPINGLSDASVLSTMADGILLVVTMAQTYRSHLATAIRTLERLNAPLLGFVFNKVNIARHGYGYYGYYSSYYYSEDETDGTKVKRKKGHRKNTDQYGKSADTK